MHPPAARFGAGNLWLCALACAGALMLAACAETPDRPETAIAPASVSPFHRALFKDYGFLVRSLKDHDVTVAGSESMTKILARKAEAAAADADVAPEDAPSNLPGADQARVQLDQAFAGGLRERAPTAAARAQASYDCWVLNAQAGRLRAAASCQGALDTALITAGASFNAPPVQAPAVATATYPTSRIVYFAFDEWSLSGEALQTITDAVWAAHDSRAGEIEIFGHTDTAGASTYNLGLSERRAKVVREVMIEMGARPPAVAAKGTGEQDLAVPTKDGVREAGNRRSVIMLIPRESRVSAR